MFEVAYAAGAAFDPAQTYEINQVIQVIIAVIVLVSGALSVFFIIWWWVMLILSGGKDDKVKPAINSIRYAVVGLIVIIISLFVAPRFGDLLGLNVSTYISPNIIFKTIKDLSGKIFGKKDDVSISNGGGSAAEDFSDL